MRSTFVIIDSGEIRSGIGCTRLGCGLNHIVVLIPGNLCCVITILIIQRQHGLLVGFGVLVGKLCNRRLGIILTRPVEQFGYQGIIDEFGFLSIIGCSQKHIQVNLTAGRIVFTGEFYFPIDSNRRR